MHPLLKADIPDSVTPSQPSRRMEWRWGQPKPSAYMLASVTLVEAMLIDSSSWHALAMALIPTSVSRLHSLRLMDFRLDHPSPIVHVMASVTFVWLRLIDCNRGQPLCRACMQLSESQQHSSRLTDSKRGHPLAMAEIPSYLIPLHPLRERVCRLGQFSPRASIAKLSILSSPSRLTSSKRVHPRQSAQMPSDVIMLHPLRLMYRSWGHVWLIAHMPLSVAFVWLTLMTRKWWQFSPRLRRLESVMSVESRKIEWSWGHADAMRQIPSSEIRLHRSRHITFSFGQPRRNPRSSSLMSE